MPPCLTLSIIRYGSRATWSNPGKGVAPSPTPWCSKLSKREPTGHPRQWSPTLLTYKSFKKGRGSAGDDERCARSKEINRPELIGQRVRVRVTLLRF